MKVRIIGDVHEGKRFAYTTPKTALEFKALHREIKRLAAPSGMTCFQVGDLFDSFSVSGETFVDGYLFARGMRLLAGNHDRSNNTEKPSAIRMLRDNFELDVAVDGFKVDYIDETAFYRLPHQLTQGDFEELLRDVQSTARERISKHKVLLLHCNYGDHAGVETENYLSTANAKQLLETFSLIVSGHEHNFSSHLDERLLMIGSIMPFSFGEMTDKGVLEYDTITGLWDIAQTWSTEDFSYNRPNKFVEMFGTMEVEAAAAVNKQIAEWYKSGQVIAVKNSTTLVRHDRSAESAEAKAEDWMQEILKQCNPAQAELLNALNEECK